MKRYCFNFLYLISIWTNETNEIRKPVKCATTKTKKIQTMERRNKRHFYYTMVVLARYYYLLIGNSRNWECIEQQWRQSDSGCGGNNKLTVLHCFFSIIRARAYTECVYHSSFTITYYARRTISWMNPCVEYSNIRIWESWVRLCLWQLFICLQNTATILHYLYVPFFCFGFCGCCLFAHSQQSAPNAGGS